MTTCQLGLPAELKHRLQYSLPREHGRLGWEPMVSVTPRDRDERRCAACEADHYEVNAYYAASSTGLDDLEDALKATPGVYLTTQVLATPSGVLFTNPGWPPALGTKRRDRRDLRVQVIALMKDSGTEGETSE